MPRISFRDTAAVSISKEDLLSMKPMLFAFAGTHWRQQEQDVLRACAHYSVDLPTTASLIGKTEKGVAWRARDTGLQLPLAWRSLIFPKVPRLFREPAVKLSYPYIVRARDDHADILLVNKLVPRGLPDWIRADVCQEIMLALLTGEIDREHLATSITPYVRKVFKMFPMKHGYVSLDESFGDGDDRTLYDVLPDTSEPYSEDDDESASEEAPLARVSRNPAAFRKEPPGGGHRPMGTRWRTLADRWGATIKSRGSATATDSLPPASTKGKGP